MIPLTIPNTFVRGIILSFLPVECQWPAQLIVVWANKMFGAVGDYYPRFASWRAL